MKQPQASIAIQVLPKVEGEEVIRVVDAVIAHIRQSGMSYTVGPFETTVEGDFDALWDLAKECQLICIQEGAPSVSTYLKVFFNPTEGVWSIEKKTAKHQK
ncbi:MAG: thiamine-binding protein [Oscillospiraceae bacterium]